jgi:cation diffusion facilitator CzcD-associated flavoprotein CzcO
MNRDTDLLIIGAGPFGLAMAAYAQDHSIDYLLVGRAMDSWRSHMPQRMLLRSRCDWHLDPCEQYTIDRFLASRGLSREEVEPLNRDFYLEYVDWFQRQRGLVPIPELVQRLDAAAGGFQATLQDGSLIQANRVLLAIGFAYFPHLPADLIARLPTGRYSHTCELVTFDHLRAKRCLIIGGRQSAFEWTALLAEAGAAAVHVSHRHPTPRFANSEWAEINQMMARFVDEPGWYRALAGGEQADVQRKFAQAKVKLEPWLWPRVDKENVTLWPETQMVSCRETDHGDLHVRLDSGDTLSVDHVILATGYRVDMAQVPFLAAGNLLPRLAMNDGFPKLDDQFQTSVPGLFITSLPATRDFGPFFGFTVAVNASAKLIGRAVSSTRRAV